MLEVEEEVTKNGLFRERISLVVGVLDSLSEI